MPRYYHSYKTEIDSVLQELQTKGISYTLFSKDGIHETSFGLPNDTHRETLAIMLATLYGAAQTANKELGKGTGCIKIYSNDGQVIIVPAGTSILAVYTNSNAPPPLEKILQTAEKISKIIPEQ